MIRSAIAFLLMLAAVPVVAAPVPVCGFTLKKTYPHDVTAFTEGLFFRNGVMFESTGYEGASVIRKYRLADGKVLAEARLPPEMFGEGIVDWGNEIISLTWRNQTGFRWDMATLRQKAQFPYYLEGWGLTHDGRSLIASDGSSTLRFYEPDSLRTLKSINVTADGRPAQRLNELEWVNGRILANVWMTDRVARIDPASGRVEAWYDLAKLHAMSGAKGADSVLNGIAWDAKGKRLFVTGKNWPKLYEIVLDRC
jgi:glutamine cyclotransferase